MIYNFQQFLNENSDYKGEHTAPNIEDCPFYNVEEYYPDIYGPDGYKYYGGNGDDNTVISIIKSAHNKPNYSVKIYRAVPDINYSVRKEIKDLQYYLDYHQRFGFFPMRQKFIYDLEDKYPVGKYGYNTQQQKVLEDIENLIMNLQNKLLDDPKINDGDWVTLSRNYAKEHGEDNLKGKFKILSKTVKASELFTDANSLQEWGYMSIKKQKEEKPLSVK